MRTLLWFFYFWCSLFCLFPALLYTIYLDHTAQTVKRDALVQRTVRGWMSSLLWLAGVQVEIEGLEQIPEQPVLFISNHQGNFDIPILLCYLGRAHGIVAKAELRRFPFLRVWMQFFGCVFLERDNPRQSMKALGAAAQNLKDGCSIIIFPEGTRSRGKPVGTFKAGAFRIVEKTGATIIPICIEGSYRAMEAQGFWIRPARVRVSLLAPIDTADLSKEARKALPTQLQEQIAAHCEILRTQDSAV